MPDWRSEALARLRSKLEAGPSRARAQSSAVLREEVLEEIVLHAEELYEASRAAGSSEEESCAIVRTQLDRLPEMLRSATPVLQWRITDARVSHSRVAGVAAALRHDLLHAVRLLRLRPSFTLLALVTLALGMGANTAVFSVVNGLLLQPLPFPGPDRLVMLWEAETDDPSSPFILAKPNYEDLASQTTSFESTAIWEYQIYNVGGDGEPVQVRGLRVSASVFSVLGIAPHLGRTFTPAEDQSGHDVAVISHAFWSSRYGARRDIVGHRILVNGRPLEVVGVMPPHFRVPDQRHSIWLPIQFTAQDASRDSHSFYAIARLREGVTFEAARAETDALGRRLAAAYPDENEDETLTITRMDEFGIPPSLRTTLIALQGAVGLVLLIACANVANLLLAQAASRHREFAVRLALGASRLRLASQLLAEGIVLSIAAGAAGVFVAMTATSALAASLPPAIARAPFREGTVGALDTAMLLFTAGVALATAVLFSLFPIAAIARTAPGAALKALDTRTSSGRTSAVRATLIGVEVALAVVVLTAAGLTMKSMARLLDVDPGLDASNVLVAEIALPQADFYGPPERPTFCDDLVREVSAVSGVRRVSAVSHLPFSGANAGRGFTIEGRPEGSGGGGASYRLSCPGYFETMGIAVVRGRDFTFRDTREAPGVVILNEAAAARYWPGEDPIGRRIKLGDPSSSVPWLTVVGVVRGARHFGLDADVPRELFRPYAQAAWPVMTITARTAIEPMVLAESLRAAARRVDPAQPVSNVRPMEAVIAQSLGGRRFPMQLLGVFAAVALALAVTGVYGVVNYSVAQRTREIGIRVALGARAAAVTALVARTSLAPVVAGLALGLAGARLSSRSLQAVLYEVSPTDPVVLAAIATVLAGAALLASWLPARRAATVDPVTVLRE